MKLPVNKGPEDLKKEVLEQGLCSCCGGCIGICPYIKAVREKVIITDNCGIKEGKCYNLCPHTPTDNSRLEKGIFGATGKDPALGRYVSIKQSRATNRRVQASGQYGGTVTALICSALERGEINRTLLTQGFNQRKADKDPLLPTARLAKNSKGVLECSGSKYTACPTLSLLGEAVNDKRNMTGVVGRPCQVTAVRKLQDIEPETFRSRVPLIIGLFCMWALSYRDFKSFLAARGRIPSVRKIDIPQEDFVIFTRGKPIRIPFEQIKELIRPSCELCPDFTSELADLSVGATEFDEDWNTLIIRSKKGQEIIDQALDDGAIELKEFPPEKLEILKRAASDKKKRVRAILKRR
ncbi:MAG: Coenzyme F420 hydrogenase/dehydrogenase, beta subunit C-terminal domain [Deltaproteobacteria bacterium]|nr:MAG: Coenzyme F420 hydrogenase/dehydrogenase, beta subunit C-terminal domain [Deltaproteobacteria bacterium]